MAVLLDVAFTTSFTVSGSGMVAGSRLEIIVAMEGRHGVSPQQTTINESTFSADDLEGYMHPL